MKLKKFIYVVIMHRWGDRESHSYFLGVYSKKKRAQNAGNREYEQRGSGKYYPEIIKTNLDSLKQKSISNTIPGHEDIFISKSLTKEQIKRVQNLTGKTIKELKNKRKNIKRKV